MQVIWPLVGRAAELAQLETALTHPGRSGAVLAGPPGVGKTRLADELAELAEARGWRVVRVVATPWTSAVTFGALIHLLPAGDPASRPADLTHGLRRALAGERPVLCHVDDAHLLDQASAAAVHMLAATGTVRVVATVRAGEPAPDAVTALWRDGGAECVELRPLSREACDELLGGRVDGAARARLWRVSGGNPLFLQELVHAGVQAGELAELVEARLAGLPDDERAALEVLALGEPLGPALLGDAFLGAAESLARRGFVRVTPDGDRTVGHPLYAEVLLSRLGVQRRRSILDGLAGTLARLGARRRGDLIRLAMWRLDSGGALDAPTLMAAGREARAVFDHRLTERFARAAVRGGGGADASVLLADALYRQGRHHEAAAVVARLPTADSRPPASHVRQAVVTSSVMFWGLGDAAAAEGVLADAADRLDTEADRDELAAHRAGVILFDGRPVEALAVAGPVLAASGATDLTRARALAAVVPALAITGQTERAVATAELGVAVARAIAEDEPWSLSHLRAGQAAAYLLAGRLAEMRELARRQYLTAIQRHTDDDRGMWGLLLGRAMLAAGEVASARDQLGEAAELLRRNDVAGFLSWCLACRARTATLLGDLTGARALLDEARRARLPTARAHQVELELADAWQAAALGEHAVAERLANRAIQLAAARGQSALEAHAVHEAIRLRVPGLCQRMVSVASTVDGPLVAVFAGHAEAFAAADGPGLDLVAEEFADLGAMVLAAEAAAEAADAHGQAGDPRRLASMETSRALAARCQGARTPVLLRAARSPEIALQDVEPS